MCYSNQFEIEMGQISRIGWNYLLSTKLIGQINDLNLMHKSIAIR